jgi:hypothetical protein
LLLSNDVSYSVTLLDLGKRLRSGELAMRVDRGIDLRTVFSVVALISCSFTMLNAARAEDKTYVMKLGTAIKSVTAVGAAVAKRKPSLEQAYDVFAAAAKRTK